MGVKQLTTISFFINGSEEFERSMKTFGEEEIEGSELIEIEPLSTLALKLANRCKK